MKLNHLKWAVPTTTTSTCVSLVHSRDFTVHLSVFIIISSRIAHDISIEQDWLTFARPDIRHFAAVFCRILYQSSEDLLRLNPKRHEFRCLFWYCGIPNVSSPSTETWGNPLARPRKNSKVNFLWWALRGASRTTVLFGEFGRASGLRPSGYIWFRIRSHRSQCKPRICQEKN